MKTTVPLKLTLLVFFLGFTVQTFSKTKNTNIMNITKNETIGLLVIMKAKPGKEQDVKNFLLGGLALVNQEPQTVSWFAFQIDNNTFGIYDTFEVEEGRQAHLTGEVAKALLANAGDLLENFDPSTDIQAIDVLASNHKSGLQNKGLLVIMKSKEAKTKDVENFLNVGKQLVGDESKTLSWYALKIDATTYAIFDTFADDSGRDAHLTGKVAAALMENAPVLLEGFEASAIQKIDILTFK
ncbi:putative quinol monooxygenase [Polaribacter uvawellassae]|uniref:putative quinol monooxygenase n=1 Tax=Polaribacter uvawellassae TaxID=3133495 RepID=UPI0032190D6F